MGEKRNKGWDNIRPPSTEEARQRGRKGGRRSGEERRKRRDLKIALETLLESDIKNRKGEVKSGAEALAIALFDKALHGDTKAFEIIRDTVGQKPADKIQVEEISQETIDEIQKAILDD